MESFCCLYSCLGTYCTRCSSVSIANFEQVNAGWVRTSFKFLTTSNKPFS